MDLNEYWQENKRFLVATTSGVVLFLAGTMVVDRAFRGELLALQRSSASAAAKLRTESMYDANALAEAQKDNEELAKTVGILTQATAFQARAGFRLDPKAGAATNQYFAAVSRVREELLRLAGRGNLRLPDDLGLPALAPTREAEIERYLEALDLVDRAVRLALANGVQRIDKIEIRLDPKLASRQGVGELEKTRVEVSASGRPAPLVHFVSASQQPGKDSGPLLVEKAEIQVSRQSADEAVLQTTFVAARVTGGP
jgi:tetratricopeptide (TPR) repeat protein